VTHRRLIDQRTAGGLARHIDLGELGVAAGPRDALHSRFALFGIAPGQHYHGAGRGETFRHSEADAAIAAGDDCDAAGKTEQAHCTLPSGCVACQSRCGELVEEPDTSAVERIIGRSPTAARTMELVGVMHTGPKK
jgi:hypothetical protein